MASTVELRVKDSHHTVLVLIVFLRFFVTPFIFYCSTATNLWK